ncbi:hypothetical protein C4546_00070 [Candidatus Parcubacteria bacterium]|jgi:hypothetical protein|nr:MAG: hypothetical protein C4546_00070 [Candidatus Parcubacteria bacterium]
MLFIKWEESVRNWKAMDRSYEYVVFACILHGFVYIGTVWGLFAGFIRVGRLLVRKVRAILWKKGWWPKFFPRGNWNGKAKTKPSRFRQKAHNLAVWLAQSKIGTYFRYVVLFLIAATPVLPLTEYVAIAFARLTKTKFGFWVIMTGLSTKVLVTVWFMYYAI